MSDDGATDPTRTHDELAGVVDLFGALTRAELVEALSELAFKQGAEPDPEAVEASVAAAVGDYAIVAVDAGAAGVEADGDVLLSGPTAFPRLPPDAEDLPHIMSVERREVDRAAVADGVLARLEEEATAAVATQDADRAAFLLDVSYDLEAWGPVAADGVRDRLDAVLSSE
jgi:hypothetical protein